MAVLFLLSFLCGMILLVLMPLAAYAVGWQDFPQVSRMELLAFSVACAVISSFALSVCLAPVVWFLPRVSGIVFAVLIGTAFAFYVQGNLIALDYGVLDGTPVDWGRFAVAGRVNTAVWIVLLAAPVVAAIRFPRRAERPFVIAALGLLSFSALVASWCFSLVPVRFARPANFSLDNLLEFSSDRNVVVFIADSFDRGILDLVLAENPVWRERLAGFEYYHNACGCFPGTHPAVPEIVTGSLDYRGENDADDYVRRAYRHSPTLAEAKRLGVRVDLYTDASEGPTLDEARELGVFANVTDDGGGFLSRVWTADVARIYRLALFRYLPHVLKPAYWDFLFRDRPASRQDGVSDGVSYEMVENELEARLRDGAVSTVPQPKLKFIHVMATHAPRFNPDQAEKTLNLFCRLREKVRAAGLADKTVFVFMADHGYSNRDRPVFMVGGNGSGFVRNEIPFSYRHLTEVFVSALSGGCTNVPTATDEEMKPLLRTARSLRVAGFDGIGTDFSGERLELISTDAEVDAEMTDGGMRLVWSGRDTALFVPLEPELRHARVTVELTVDDMASHHLDTVTVSAFGRDCPLWQERDGVLAFTADLSDSPPSREFLVLMLKSAARSPLSLSRLSISLTGPRPML